jgi:hypothetical protein
VWESVVPAHLLLLGSEMRKSIPFLWASKIVSREPITSSSPGWGEEGEWRRGRGVEEGKGSGGGEG